MLSCTLDTYTSIWICSLARFILSTDYPAQYLMKRRKCNVDVTTRSNLRNVIIGTSSFQTSWKHATGTRSESERERVFRRLAYFPDCPRPADTSRFHNFTRRTQVRPIRGFVFQGHSLWRDGTEFANGRLC